MDFKELAGWILGGLGTIGTSIGAYFAYRGAKAAKEADAALERFKAEQAAATVEETARIAAGTAHGEQEVRLSAQRDTHNEAVNKLLIERVTALETAQVNERERYDADNKKCWEEHRTMNTLYVATREELAAYKALATLADRKAQAVSQRQHEDSVVLHERVKSVEVTLAAQGPPTSASQVSPAQPVNIAPEQGS